MLTFCARSLSTSAWIGGIGSRNSSLFTLTADKTIVLEMKDNKCTNILNDKIYFSVSFSLSLSPPPLSLSLSLSLSPPPLSLPLSTNKETIKHITTFYDTIRDRKLSFRDQQNLFESWRCLLNMGSNIFIIIIIVQ